MIAWILSTFSKFCGKLVGEKGAPIKLKARSADVFQNSNMNTLAHLYLALFFIAPYHGTRYGDIVAGIRYAII